MTGVPASPSGSRASHEADKPSSPEALIPNAEALIALMSAWSSLSDAKFHAAYPFFRADRERIIQEYELGQRPSALLESTALLFAEYADELYASAIEARRAETHSGSVHESAPGRPNPVDPISRTPKGGEA